MNPILSILLLGLTFSSVSCSQKSIQLDTALNSNQCGFSQQKLVYIDSNEQLKALFKQTFNNPIKSLGDIDFKKSGLILVSMGQQPTSGYSIQLNSKNAMISNNTLMINASLKKPLSNSYNAQIITSPCVLYKIKKYNFDSIKLMKKRVN